MTDQELIGAVCDPYRATDFGHWNPPDESEFSEINMYSQDPRVLSITFEMPLIGCKPPKRPRRSK